MVAEQLAPPRVLVWEPLASQRLELLMASCGAFPLEQAGALCSLGF